MDPELTLEKAKIAIRQKEAVHGQQAVLHSEPTSSPIDIVERLRAEGLKDKATHFS